MMASVCTTLSRSSVRAYSKSLLLQSIHKHGVCKGLFFGTHRCMSAASSFNHKDVHITFADASQIKNKPPVNDLVFGKHFSDHMLEIEWDGTSGWKKPTITPFHNLSLHPAAKVLHYATELFEGMKAYRTCSGRIALFRPDMNMKRMIRTANRSSLPTFEGPELIELIKRLIQIDQEWVPHEESSSLYIRPAIISHEDVLKVEQPNKALLFVILSPTGPYFTSGYNPVSLLADPQYVRAWPGGCGDAKMGANYAPTLAIQKEAMKKGHAQVLWLYGEGHQITEVGAMNIMIVLDKGKGKRELVTPPLNGLILPGVTRASLLELARSWNEFEVTERNITMEEFVSLSKEGKVLEMFGCGTAAVVCPVGEISYMGETIRIPPIDHKKSLCTRFYDTITDIQYGRTPHPWCVYIDE